jgi:uncharacterized membrane protein YkvA (DUF1232 family)
MANYYISEIVLKFKLTLRLVRDSRVSFWLKLIPIFCLIYFVSPVDALVGPIDDAVMIYLGMDLFIHFCPDDVVEEHRLDLQTEAAPVQQEDEEIIDAEFKE